MKSPDMQVPGGDRTRTRSSLIRRIRDCDDGSAWDRFAGTYQRLIYSVASKCGLRSVEAEEVVQETLISVAKNIDRFKTDHRTGSFRSWLLRLARWRIVDQMRKRRNGNGWHLNDRLYSEGGEGDTTHLNQIPDPKGNVFDSIWDEEERRTLSLGALEKLRREVKPEHFQIFHLYAVRGLPASEVAKRLGASRMNIYQVYRRLNPIFTKAQQQLKDGLLTEQ